MNRETLRILLVGSSVVAATLSVWFGLPRLKRWITPDLDRVWVVSAALGDEVASLRPREVVSGTPVTLFAVIEGGGDDGPRLFGSVDRVRLGGPDSEVLEVEPWSSWWYPVEFLWFKVEPVYPFDNEDFAADFRPDQIQYQDTFMLTWGFRDRHAADIGPTGDAYPDWEVGTMRYRVQVVLRDAEERVLDEAVSPGAGAVHASRFQDRPHRISVRASDEPLGRIQAWAGLPYVPFPEGPPPAEHPAERFLGGTILDFWIASLRRGGADWPYFGWEELPRRAEVVVDEMFLASDDVYRRYRDPGQAITWDEVQPGDLVAIEDHVGVLYQDRGPGGGGDGVLNRWDRLLGGYFEPLRDLPLGDAFLSGATVYRLPAPTSSSTAESG